MGRGRSLSRAPTRRRVVDAPVVGAHGGRPYPARPRGSCMRVSTGGRPYHPCPTWVGAGPCTCPTRRRVVDAPVVGAHGGRPYPARPRGSCMRVSTGGRPYHPCPTWVGAGPCTCPTRRRVVDAPVVSAHGGRPYLCPTGVLRAGADGGAPLPLPPPGSCVRAPTGGCLYHPCPTWVGAGPCTCPTRRRVVDAPVAGAAMMIGSHMPGLRMPECAPVALCHGRARSPSHRRATENQL